MAKKTPPPPQQNVNASPEERTKAALRSLIEDYKAAGTAVLDDNGKILNQELYDKIKQDAAMSAYLPFSVADAIAQGQQAYKDKLTEIGGTKQAHFKSAAQTAWNQILGGNYHPDAVKDQPKFGDLWDKFTSEVAPLDIPKEYNTGEDFGPGERWTDQQFLDWAKVRVIPSLQQRSTDYTLWQRLAQVKVNTDPEIANGLWDARREVMQRLDQTGMTMMEAFTPKGQGMFDDFLAKSPAFAAVRSRNADDKKLAQQAFDDYINRAFYQPLYDDLKKATDETTRSRLDERLKAIQAMSKPLFAEYWNDYSQGASTSDSLTRAVDEPAPVTPDTWFSGHSSITDAMRFGRHVNAPVPAQGNTAIEELAKQAAFEDQLQAKYIDPIDEQLRVTEDAGQRKALQNRKDAILKNSTNHYGLYNKEGGGVDVGTFLNQPRFLGVLGGNQAFANANLPDPLMDIARTTAQDATLLANTQKLDGFTKYVQSNYLAPLSKRIIETNSPAEAEKLQHVYDAIIRAGPALQQDYLTSLKTSPDSTPEGFFKSTPGYDASLRVDGVAYPQPAPASGGASPAPAAGSGASAGSLGAGAPSSTAGIDEVKKAQADVRRADFLEKLTADQRRDYMALLSSVVPVQVGDGAGPPKMVPVKSIFDLSGLDSIFTPDKATGQIKPFKLSDIQQALIGTTAGPGQLPGLNPNGTLGAGTIASLIQQLGGDPNKEYTDTSHVGDLISRLTESATQAQESFGKIYGATPTGNFQGGQNPDVIAAKEAAQAEEEAKQQRGIRLPRIRFR